MAWSLLRPGCWPRHRACRSARMSLALKRPVSKALSRSPDLVGASSVSTKTSLPMKQSAAASTMLGLKLPTRSRWVPGRSQLPWMRGSSERVAQLMMSAWRAAASSDAGVPSSGWTLGTPCLRRVSASTAARTGRGFQMSMCSMSRTARMAAGSSAAMRPAPTTSSRLASLRARRSAPSAAAPAVRRAVMASPSMRASGTPVVALYST